MDSNEEFEFKPLTEGLGFHSKKIDLAYEVKKSKIISEMISTKIIKEAPSIPPTLARVGTGDVIDELIESFKRPAPSFIETKKDLIFDKITSDQKLNGVKTAWALAPFLVDVMMVAALFLVGLIISLYVTKVDIIDFIINSVGQWQNIIVLPAIFFMMVFVYSILTRIFMGGTLGETIFDMQLGNSIDQKSSFYGFKVIARLFIVTVTGFITLPLISWIFRNDLSGKITGLCLVKKK